MSRKDRQRDVYGIRDYKLAPEGSADESDDSHYDFLSVIDILEFDNINMIDDKTPYKRFVYTEMPINKDKVIFQVNRGTSVNIVNEKYMKGKAVQPTTKVLKMWNGSHLKPIGINDRLIVKNPKIGKKSSVEFVLVPDDYTPIIRPRTAQQMKVITVHDNNFTTVSPNNVNNVSIKDDLIKKYEDVFSKELETFNNSLY